MEGSKCSSLDGIGGPESTNGDPNRHITIAFPDAGLASRRKPRWTSNPHRGLAQYMPTYLVLPCLGSGTGTRVENTVPQHRGRTARTGSSDWSFRAEEALSCVLHDIRLPVVALIQPHGNLGFHGVVERIRACPLVRSWMRQTTTHVMCRFTMIVEEL